jgi:nitrilase
MSSEVQRKKEQITMDKNETIFRVAGVQMSPVLFDRDGATEKIITLIERCGTEDIRLAVFPETIIPNYPYFAMVNPPITMGKLLGKLYDQAVEIPGPVTESVGAAAAKSHTVVVLGVNERDRDSLYNTQIIFDADGTLLGKRRKIMPSYHERMIWGWGDGSGLTTFDTAVGRIGALICWEHYMPLARYTLIANGEQIHCSHFPGSMLGEHMSHQLDAAIRHHAMESGAFVVNATCWMDEKQRTEITSDEDLMSLLQGGICTAVVSPQGRYLAGPLPEGEGMAVAEVDLNHIVRQKSMLDTAGHYARPDIFRFTVDRTPRKVLEETATNFEVTPKDALEKVEIREVKDLPER